jgi:cytochrome c oxidase subunit II
MNTDKLKQDLQDLQDKCFFLSALICVNLRFQKLFSGSRLFLVTTFAIFVLSGCRGSQSALDAAGVQSERLENLWWMFFYVCAAVYLIVMAVLLAAWYRAKKADAETAPEIAPSPEREKRISNIVKGAVAVTLVTLFVLMISSFRTGRAINSLSQAQNHLSIKVTGHQWWWEIEYQDAIPSNNVTTANELHIPVGRPVLLELVSRDVIHSFWVPALHGKRDLIPGHDSTTYIEADHAGVFRGQCAEFCGAQHAKMGFLVVAEAPDAFEAWRAQQLRPAAPPEQLSAAAGRGRQLFLGGTCPMCHTVAGTTAGATMGPDLTHVASRQTLGAGSLPNVRQQLQSWVVDPHAVKPGTRMPPSALAATDVPDLVSYLEALR